jgi:hypothetical protein
MIKHGQQTRKYQKPEENDVLFYLPTKEQATPLLWEQSGLERLAWKDFEMRYYLPLREKGQQKNRSLLSLLPFWVWIVLIFLVMLCVFSLR